MHGNQTLLKQFQLLVICTLSAFDYCLSKLKCLDTDFHHSQLIFIFWLFSHSYLLDSVIY